MSVKFENDLNLSDEAKDEVFCILPDGFNTIVTDYSQIGNASFSVEMRTAIFNKDEAIYWKSQLEEKSKTYYNLDSTFQDNTQKTVFKRVYHCMHNTRPGTNTINPHVKHTNCRAKLIINVKKPEMKRSKDVYLKDYPCKISLRYEHNHAMDYADSLLFKKPSKEVEQKFIELFTKGHSPSAARRVYKAELEENANEKCPPSEWCCELYYNMYQRYFKDDSNVSETDNAIEVNFVASDSLDSSEETTIESNFFNVEGSHDTTKKKYGISGSPQNQVVEQNFIEATSIVLEKYRTNPDLFLDSINKFCLVIKQVKSNDAIISALNNLGQNVEEKSKKNNVCGKIVGVNGKLRNRSLQGHPYSK